MKRDIYEKLLEWKSSPRRKPLLLQGARQTGKTFILKQFGGNEYDKIIYCNFEENPDLDQFFQRDLNPKRILAELSIYMNQTIKPGVDLLVFDEIQVSNRALNSLKTSEQFSYSGSRIPAWCKAVRSGIVSGREGEFYAPLSDDLSGVP